MKKKDFSDKLILWYQQYQRNLPWRTTQNPYLIWLSEIILQQTRVVQGLPYYQKFVQQYPSIEVLAAADEREILRLWQGLGYYSRARNMHATARLINDDLDGIFPKSYKELIKLKGIGSYTAAAIASFAFAEKVAVLDGNVYRVLARVFGEETDISSSQAKNIFAKLANDLLPDADSATYNQAIMEFGSMQCTPTKPDCLGCPFTDECIAKQTERQNQLPVKLKKTKIRQRFFSYFVLEQHGKLLLHQRNENDIWKGLFDFYLVENAEKFPEIDGLSALISASESYLRQVYEPPIHLLSHQRIHAKFWHVIIDSTSNLVLPEGFYFYSLDEIEKLPKPILVQNYLKKYFF